jgi:Putative prokaryotic signal transducing protein
MTDEQLAILMSAANEFEADIVVGLLEDAGIESFQRLGGAGVAGRIGGGGSRDVLVAETDLEQAREVLDSAQADGAQQDGAQED